MARRDWLWAIRYPAYKGLVQNVRWFLRHPIYAGYWATHNGRPYSSRAGA